MGIESRNPTLILDAILSALPSRISTAIATIATDHSITLVAPRTAPPSYRISDQTDLAVDLPYVLIWLEDNKAGLLHRSYFVQDWDAVVCIGVVYQGHDPAIAYRYASLYATAVKMAMEKVDLTSVGVWSVTMWPDYETEQLADRYRYLTTVRFSTPQRTNRG